ncbi:MAG: hypothetical protein K6G34_12675 [Lachnospiraceae bacterium]|nr:hypothetical protein [Lachnospiraceae bacterium]
MNELSDIKSNNELNNKSEAGHGNTGSRIVLNAQQSEAVKTVEGPVLLLAVPGTASPSIVIC